MRCDRQPCPRWCRDKFQPGCSESRTQLAYFRVMNSLLEYAARQSSGGILRDDHLPNKSSYNILEFAWTFDIQPTFKDPDAYSRIDCGD